MKVALLTIWHEKNYGAVLQAYATIKALKLLGHNPYMINIHIKDTVKSTFVGKIANIIEYFTPATYKFNRFWRKYIPVTKKYDNIDELYSHPPVADCYIVGSDQVWNPDITKKYWKIFFLDFGSNDIKRISYASSIGVNKWMYDRYTESIHKLLHNFSHVTCREETGVEILREVFGIGANCVLDPTLLFDSYDEFVPKRMENKTLVYYPLSEDDELESYCKELAYKLGLKPVNTNKKTKILCKLIFNRVGVEDWVNNIANANFVITRSFHGLAFCLIFQKQFAILQSRNGRGTRLENLLSKLNLSNRIYCSTAQMDLCKPWEETIDYSKITPLLESLRQQSWNILKKMLEE